ncbi:hypothetical protein F5B20DRAFT_475552 [Whalleya microplaca]|nr:hypothetical protein F5B20DRAFT_475552 [Whalleya microplaca]
MGGLAFSSGENPLYTPRMPTAVYDQVRDECHAKLRELFVVVATPIPGPAKEDHGDIDIFMTWERRVLFPSSSQQQDLPQDPLDAAAQLLNAQRTKKEQAAVWALAIPWPENMLPPSEEGTNAKQPFIQVDVHLSPSLEDLQWMLFKHAHGDLWNLLGSTIRPFGLTVDGVGLYVRIPEIEAHHRKQARVLLTTDAHEVLNFLGLSAAEGRWEEPFRSTQEVFEYATTCRLFWVRPESDSEVDGVGGDVGGEEGGAAGAMGGTFEPQTLKSNDRRRMKYRPLYRAWVDEFLPSCRASGRFATSLDSPTRDSVREEALTRFSGARVEYKTRLLEWRKLRQKEMLWKDVIKEALPETLEPWWRSCCAAALKKIIMQDDKSFGFTPSEPLRDADGMYVESRVRSFVERSWKQIGDEAWKQNHDRFEARKTAKESKSMRSVSDNEKKDGYVEMKDAK